MLTLACGTLVWLFAPQSPQARREAAVHIEGAVSMHQPAAGEAASGDSESGEVLAAVAPSKPMVAEPSPEFPSAPLAAVIREANPVAAAPVEAPSESSAAVDIGLVSPEAAEPTSPVAPRKAAQKRVVAKRSVPAQKRPAKRITRAAKDADIDIITAIVRNASAR